MPLDAFLFTGIAGVRKRKRLEHLRKHILRDIPADRHEHTIPIIEIARLTRSEAEGDLFDLYRTYDDRLSKLRTKLSSYRSKSAEIRCLFLHTHLTHFLTGHFRSCIGSLNSPELFKDVNLKLIINLIDNIYTCKHEVANEGYPYTLAQLITWRDNELMATEVMAGLAFPGKPEFETSKVVAINHCVNMVERLLFSRDVPSLYMAYPISKIRDLRTLSDIYGDAQISDIKPEVRGLNASGERAARLEKLIYSLKKEFTDGSINDLEERLLEQNREYRDFFGRRFVAYDPGTIDEMPLVSKLKHLYGATTVTMNLEDRWPLVCDSTMRLAGWDTLAALGQLQLGASEIGELVVPIVSDHRKFQTSIERQVRSRDFRLIEQSDGLIAYPLLLAGAGVLPSESKSITSLDRSGDHFT